MKTRFASLLVLGVLVSMTLSAQTRISGSLSCSKPDPVYSIPTGNESGTVMNLAKVSCTWSKTMEMAGVSTKDGSSVSASEVEGGKTKDHGIHIGSMANGDKYYVHFQSTGMVKPDHSGTSEGTWSFDGGTGKLKGLTGKGTFKSTNNADGTSTVSVEGEYKTP